MIEIEGVDSVKATIEQLKVKSGRKIGAIASQVLSESINLADRHTKSGRLINALQMRKIDDYDYEVFSDKQMAPHALFVHFGTKKHVIKPKKKALRWGGAGGFVFAKGVEHPGYKGDPYLYRAARLVSQRMQQIIERTE